MCHLFWKLVLLVLVAVAIDTVSNGLQVGWPRYDYQAHELSSTIRKIDSQVLRAFEVSSPIVQLPDQRRIANRETTQLAIERSLPYLQRGGESWIADKGCVSCHRVSFMIWTHHESLKRGFDVDQNWLQSKTDWALVNMLADRKEGGGVDTISQMLLGRDRQSPWRKKPPKHFKTVDPYESLFELLLTRQSDDGSWPPEGQLTTPPELTTCWTLLALGSRYETTADPASTLDPDKDLEDGFAKQLDQISKQIPIQRDLALKFLEQIEPHPTHEGLVLRLLVASTTQNPALNELRQRVIAAQLKDGGWPNLPESSKSDAYATGLTLYALSQLKGDVDPNVVAKGQQFLIRTQQPDGSWSITANQIRSGKSSKSLNEVYSYWGSAWATLGLLHAIPVRE